MKASLCKLSPCTVTLVCDYHAKLFLIAISSTLKSLLRPHILNTPDKSPGDRLTEICAKITDVGGSCPHPAGHPELLHMHSCVWECPKSHPHTVHWELTVPSMGVVTEGSGGLGPQGWPGAGDRC